MSAQKNKTTPRKGLAKATLGKNKQTGIKFRLEGEKIKAVCDRDGLSEATLFYREYISPTTGKIIPNVLQAFCNTCKSLVALPAQSLPKIREHLAKEQVPLEVRIPASLEDVGYLLGDRLHLEVHQALKELITLYGKHPNIPLAKALSDGIAQGKAVARISAKIPTEIDAILKELMGRTDLGKSDVIKAILARAKQDFLDNPTSKLAREFEKRTKRLAA